MADGIDFMAIARGREAALADNYKDIRRIQEQEQYDIKREEQFRDQRDKRAMDFASRYLAPLNRYRQEAINEGIGQAQWFANMLSTIRSDPAFLGQPPEIQNEILKQTGQIGTVLADTSSKAGDLSGAQQIYQAMGLSNVQNPTAVAAQTGNWDVVLANAGYTPDPKDATKVLDRNGFSTNKLDVMVAMGSNPTFGVLAGDAAARQAQINQENIDRGAAQRAEQTALLAQEQTLQRNKENALLRAQSGVEYDATGNLINSTTRQPLSPMELAAMATAQANAAAGTAPSAVASGTPSTADTVAAIAGNGATSSAGVATPIAVPTLMASSSPAQLTAWKAGVDQLIATEQAALTEALRQQAALPGLPNLTQAQRDAVNARVLLHSQRLDEIAKQAKAQAAGVRAVEEAAALNNPTQRLAAIQAAQRAKALADINRLNRANVE